MNQQKFEQALKELNDSIINLSERVELNPEDEIYNEWVRNSKAALNEYMKAKKDSERFA
jgi:hypothetical protein